MSDPHGHGDQKQAAMNDTVFSVREKGSAPLPITSTKKQATMNEAVFSVREKGSVPLP